MKYLGFLITASRFIKIDYRILMDKILAKVQVWQTRHPSFAGRVMLINTVIFSTLSCQVSIFIIPQEVLEKITQVCKKFLWSGQAKFKRAPHISAYTSCLPRKYRGLGIKYFTTWNKAMIAKLVWAISIKKDLLWVKWIHGKYLRGQNRYTYTPPRDYSQYWRKICQVKEQFKLGCTNPSNWGWQGSQTYKVNLGYQWLLGLPKKVPQAKNIWVRTLISRYAITVWALMHYKIPAK